MQANWDPGEEDVSQEPKSASILSTQHEKDMVFQASKEKVCNPDCPEEVAFIEDLGTK